MAAYIRIGMQNAAMVNFDDTVVSKAQAAAILSIHPDTLDRMHQRGEGPNRIKRSARLVGYRMRDLRAWLNERAG